MFYKTSNNILYGKSVQNLRKHVNVNVVSNEKQAKKLIAKPIFKRSVIINKDLQLIETRIPNLTLNRPVFAGFTVLETSKLHMYRFYYDVVKKMYPGDRSTLAYTDTDSTLLVLKTDDAYKDMVENSDFFDFSEYPRDAKIFQKLKLSEEEITELMEKNRKASIFLQICP